MKLIFLKSMKAMKTSRAQPDHSTIFVKRAHTMVDLSDAVHSLLGFIMF